MATMHGIRCMRVILALRLVLKANRKLALTASELLEVRMLAHVNGFDRVFVKL